MGIPESGDDGLGHLHSVDMLLQDHRVVVDVVVLVHRRLHGLLELGEACGGRDLLLLGLLELVLGDAEYLQNHVGFVRRDQTQPYSEGLGL